MEMTHMQPLTLSQTELLTQQAMVALQANDKARAYDLLGRAIQLAPHNEQAWLWLSGAVESAAERRYCLEQVLVINPHNAAAQRGMATLPAALPVSPFPDPAPVDVHPADLTLAAPTDRPIAQATSLLDIVDQPGPFVAPATRSAPTGPIGSAEPAVVTYAPPGAPATDRHDQALANFVVREFGRHRSRDEITRALSEQHGMAWGEAQALVAQVASEHRRSIAARQSPFLIFLGIATLIGGCFLVGRGVFVLWLLQSEPTLVRSMNPRLMGGTIVQMGLGVMMVLGSLIGMGQTIKGLFR
jgi:hypothetical protein